MQKISSPTTFVSKKVLPVLWFGFLAYFVVRTLLSGAARKDPLLLVFTLLVAALGYVMLKKFVWNLVDEVYDGGDFLVIKNRSEEERVALANIINVSVATYPNPSRITLRLKQPGKFGQEITFAPAASSALHPFAKNRIAEDLIVRVDQARSKRTA
jgi:hypothetical protein